MSDSFSQHILRLVSSLEKNVKATPPVWEGPHTEYTEAVLNAINALGVRCRQAEADLDTIRREHPDICLPSSSRSLDGHIVDSAMDTTCEVNASKVTQDTLGPTEQTHYTGNSSNDIAREEVKLLKAQIHDVTRVCTAIWRGDLDQKVEVEAEGEMLILKSTMNVLVDDLAVIISEVTRIFLEIGVEGIFGGQAEPRWGREPLEGSWASFINHINRQAANLTDQSRSISLALENILSGDYTAPISFPEMRGETLGLQQTVTALRKWMIAEALMEQPE
ncbi:hypothetical protein Agabi119p4_1401 [Agaricus bisporus var. burnettii]|uniref:HAMP domain-containing protein n=1 Tax=Agaricus bisporus var. burnettii TaxID=192524 RepID=A0A8H7F9R3_AGABI|nr:hypothetical protein Agabi119p4_1401 [Agaricus bisporus var. burnettii]